MRLGQIGKKIHLYFIRQSDREKTPIWNKVSQSQSNKHKRWATGTRSPPFFFSYSFLSKNLAYGYSHRSEFDCSWFKAMRNMYICLLLVAAELPYCVPVSLFGDLVYVVVAFIYIFLSTFSLSSTLLFCYRCGLIVLPLSICIWIQCVRFELDKRHAQKET